MRDTASRSDRLLSLGETADLIGLTPHALYRWRTLRQGPPSLKIGNRVKYRESALMQWIEEQEARDPR